MYRYFCKSENEQIYDIRSSVPTKCKNNINHCVEWKTLAKYYNSDSNTDSCCADITSLTTQVAELQTTVDDMQVDVTANTNRRKETTTITETITATGLLTFDPFPLNTSDPSIQYGTILVTGITLDGIKNACFKFQIIFKNNVLSVTKVNDELIFALDPSGLNWTCDIQIVSNEVTISVNSFTDTVKWKQYTILY